MLRLLSCQNIALPVIHLGDRNSNQLVHGKCRVESFDRSVELFRVDTGQQIHHWVIVKQRIAYHLDCLRESTASGCQQNFPRFDIFASLERFEFWKKR